MDFIIPKQCSRCGRIDLEVLSNNLCKRCDNVLFGFKPNESII